MGDACVCLCVYVKLCGRILYLSWVCVCGGTSKGICVFMIVCLYVKHSACFCHRYKSSIERSMSHGQKVVQTVLQKRRLLEFQQEWRQHFVDTMHPAYLPELWSVSHKPTAPLRPLPVQAGGRPSSSGAAGFTTDSALHWKRYNYTYSTTLAVFGDLPDPQVW